ncbi:hypothetical protein TNCV_4568291 [Trichonephila clavipes]|nr:hypothetical protein TNCV_4568291 [Trichonephila clavipes]
MSHSTATGGFLATDMKISNHGQMTRTSPKLETLLLSSTPHPREDVCTSSTLKCIGPKALAWVLGTQTENGAAVAQWSRDRIMASMS